MIVESLQANASFPVGRPDRQARARMADGSQTTDPDRPAYQNKITTDNRRTQSVDFVTNHWPGCR